MKKTQNLHQRDILILSLVYLLSHGMILLNKGVFWDDWTFYLNIQNIETLTHEIGNPGQSFFIGLLLNSVNGPVIGRFITFFSFYFSMILLYDIIRKINRIPPITRLFLVIIFAIFPVNMARIAMVDVFYSVCYFLFFLGLWLVSIQVDRPNPFFRVTSLVVFFIAFFTNSLLVFYVLVVLYVFYQQRFEIVSFHKALRLVMRHLDYLFLPILFWIIKTIFFVPNGHYADYNKLTFEGILKAPTLMKTTFNTSILQVIRNSLNGFTFPFIVAGLIIGIAIIWLDSLEKENFNQDLRWYCYLGLAILGFFVFVVAVFPYNVLGLVPSNGDWNSRHQLLIPLGATMMICFGFEFLLRMIDKKGRASILLLSIIAMLFIRINMLGYFDYQRDWYKQQGIIANFESNTIIENHSTFIIKDEYQSANAFGRSYRFYEYSGYLRSLYHEETRFMLPHESYESSDYEMNAFKPYFDPYFSLGSYISIRPEYTIQIEKGSINLESRLNLLKLIYDEWMDTDKFMIERNRFVLVEFVEIE